MHVTRRAFLAAGTAAALTANGAAAAERYAICAFSKHFQWTGVREMSAMAAEIGYDAIDLTVRGGGHVLPERVSEDLPRAEEEIRAAGLKLAMITSNIGGATQQAARVVETLARLKVRQYRWDGFRYDLNRPLPPQLAEFKARLKDMAAMNRQYGVCSMYHTHSGTGRAGASIWDLYILLDGLNPAEVAANYDVGHATVEGGFGGWRHTSRLMQPYMRGVALKDFKWERNARGQWEPGWCAFGDGMVNFREFLPMLKSAAFAGPMQLHFEYPELGGADAGKTKLEIPKEKFVAVMKRDIGRLKEMLRDAGMA